MVHFGSFLGWQRLARLAVVLLLAGCAVPGRPAGEPPPGASARTPESTAQVERLLAMGDQALQGGDHATAVALFQRAAVLDPTDPRPGSRLGNALLAGGQAEQGLEAFKTTLRLYPDDAEAARGYARAMLALDRPEAAAAQVEATLRAHPNDVRLLSIHGVLHDLAGRHAEAEAIYRRALALDAGNAAVLNNLGLSLMLDGRYDEAIAVLRPLAEGPRSSARARQNLAAAYGLQGDAREAARLSRLDLDEVSVKHNLATFELLRGIGRSAATARALLPDDSKRSPATADVSARPAADTNPAPRSLAPDRQRRPAADPVPNPRPVPLIPSRERAPGAPRPTAASSRAEARVSGAGASDGRAGAPSGMATAGAMPTRHDGSASPAPSASVARRWDLPVAEPPDPAAGHAVVTAAGFELAAAPAGVWTLDFGPAVSAEEATARFQELQRLHGDLLRGLVRLAGGGGGAQPLIAGTLASEAVAQRICAALTLRGVTCAVVEL